MSKFTAKRVVSTLFPRGNVLMEVVISEEDVTLRTYAEVIESPENAPIRTSSNVGLPHQDAASPVMAATVTELLPGKMLRSDLADKMFVELGSSVVRKNWLFKGAGEWTDACIWCMPIGSTGAPAMPFNATADNVDRKSTARYAASLRDQLDAVLIFVPFDGTPFTECSIVVRANANLGIVSNVEGFVESNAPLQDIAAKMRPTINLVESQSSVTVDGRSTATVELVDPNTGKRITGVSCWLYLECTAGYLPYQRVKVKADGTAVVHTMALGLQTGDTFKVKVGFKQFSGILDIPFNVV